MAVGEGRRERRSSKQDKGEDIGRCIWTYGPDVRCMMNAAVSLRTHGPEVLLPGYCSWHYATLNSGSEFDTFEQFCLWLDVQIEDVVEPSFALRLVKEPAVPIATGLVRAAGADDDRRQPCVGLPAQGSGSALAVVVELAFERGVSVVALAGGAAATHRSFHPQPLWSEQDPEDWWKLVQGRGISPKAPWHPVDDRHCPHIPATSHERIVKPHEARKLVGEILRNLGDSPMMRGTPEPEVDLSHD